MRIFIIVITVILKTLTPVMAEDWNKEQQAIIDLNIDVPTALKERGFEAFSSLFHPGYTNWYMAGDKESLVKGEDYLANVKVWFEKGNYAVYSSVIPISVEIFGDVAYMRHIQEEHFVHPDGTKSMFLGQMASLMKKHKGKWTFYSTSFQERYRGPMIGIEKNSHRIH